MKMSLTLIVMKELEEAVGTAEALNIANGVYYIAQDLNCIILQIFSSPGVLYSCDYDGLSLRRKDGLWKESLWDGEHVFLWLKSRLLRSPLSGEFDDVVSVEDFKTFVVEHARYKRDKAREVLKKLRNGDLTCGNVVSIERSHHGFTSEDQRIFFDRYEKQMR